MCGIAGIVRAQNNATHDQEIRNMTQALAHRGPDGWGIYSHDNVAIGHTRLSIIDLDSGQQPMSNEDGSIWITYNGEVYNYRELARQLNACGHQFKTRSDTETLIHAYEQWGDDFVKCLRGMFSFAIVDYRKRRILLARDRVGIKPLYYRIGKNYLAFASELSSLMKVHDGTPSGNCHALSLYMRFEYIPSPHTIYNHIYKLPPACYLVSDFNGSISRPVTYWQLQYQHNTSITDEQWLDRLDHAVTESVKAHLIADVPVGVLLSGGIDSTLIAMKASQLSSKPVKAFCIGFNDKSICELEYARQAAERCGLELESEIVTENSLHLLPDLVKHYGEPFADSSALATWYVGRLARRHVPAVLSGDGGDEMFGGYNSYLRWMSSASWYQAYDYFRQWPRLGIKWALGVAHRKWLQPNHQLLREWILRNSYMSRPERPNLWQEQFQQTMDVPADLFIETAEKARHLHRLDFAQFMDFHTYLPCDILTKVDVATMYHGLEARPPLLDNNIINLAANIPPHLRIRRLPDGTLTGKYILKRLLKDIFPPDFTFRKKQGFAIPTTEWFQHGNTASCMLNDMIDDPDSQLTKLFRPEPMRQATEQYQRSGLLWRLLVLGIWLEQNRNIDFNPHGSTHVNTTEILPAITAKAA